MPVIETEDRIITRTYELEFRYTDDPEAGFVFPCDEHGTVDEKALCPEAVANLRLCQAGEAYGKKVYRRGILKFDSVDLKCSCGSGKRRYALEDARGIFCCNVCEDCEEEARKRYRVDVLEDPQYVCDEPIEPEDY